MTVKTYFGRKTIPTATVTYWMITHTGREHQISRKFAAQVSQDAALPVAWRIERRVVESHVQGCPWCGARPMQWERDCDGWYPTATCGSEQCNQLRRCDGCGSDGTARYHSYRGHLCETCHETAIPNGLMAAMNRYALVPIE